MQRTLHLIALAFILVTAMVAGCKSNPVKPEVEIRLAPIHEAKVNIAESYPP